MPNVSWGLLNHEADLLIMSRANILTEIEIKTSKQDLIADTYKQHKHKSKIIKYLYFAIPRKLENSIVHIPENAGIYIVDINGKVQKERNAIANLDMRKVKEEEKYNLARLSCMRIWNLKESLYTSHLAYKNLYEKE